MKVEQRPSYVGVEIPGKASDPLSLALRVLRSELMQIGAFICANLENMPLPVLLSMFHAPLVKSGARLGVTSP